MPIKRPGPAFTGVSEVLDVEIDGRAVRLEVISWAFNQERAEAWALRRANRSPGPGILELLDTAEFQVVETQELELERRLVIKGFKVTLANRQYRMRFL